MSVVAADEERNFTFNTDYNFDAKKSQHQLYPTRNLHCWSMSASLSPWAYKSYNFSIRANSSLLQDLKYEQRSSPYDRGAGGIDLIIA